ncbi:diguanylate cyclase [Klebsiella oxytoca]|nr:diguanylate cyclase [Klebsiella oxytoca]
MLGTIGSYPDWLVCAQGRVINQNDALIFYFFRNVMMAVFIYNFDRFISASPPYHSFRKNSRSGTAGLFYFDRRNAHIVVDSFQQLTITEH